VTATRPNARDRPIELQGELIYVETLMIEHAALSAILEKELLRKHQRPVARARARAR
jgi:hypothetical protein